MGQHIQKNAQITYFLEKKYVHGNFTKSCKIINIDIKSKSLNFQIEISKIENLNG